jgi:hypothetical protein
MQMKFTRTDDPEDRDGFASTPQCNLRKMRNDPGFANALAINANSHSSLANGMDRFVLKQLTLLQELLSAEIESGSP